MNNNTDVNLLRNNIHTLRALARRTFYLTEAEQGDRIDGLLNMLRADQLDAECAVRKLTDRWKVRDYQRDGKVYVAIAGIDSSHERYMMVYAIHADVCAVERFRDHHFSLCDGVTSVSVITPEHADEFYAASRTEEQGVLA